MFLMKKIILLLSVCALVGACRSRTTPVKPSVLPVSVVDSISLPVTPVKNQGRTGACWAFGTVSLLESELLRTDSDRMIGLSEMWFVRQAYQEKAEQYVRTRGRRDFAQGGELQDVLQLVRRYGAVPRTVYPGNIVDGAYDHTALARAVHRWAVRTVRCKRYKNPDWRQELERLLDDYLGPVPERFEANGEWFTPRSYADSLGIHPERYVALTSFMHHPYYAPFVLEVPDNWMGAFAVNVPLDELVEAVNGALSKGYTVAWDADISEPGFRWRLGMAGMPKGTDCSAMSRQLAFDTQTTTDDHIMHIVGIARRGDGRLCYRVKNSWGTDNAKDGYIYVTENYLKMKTICVLMSRDALSPELADRCRRAAE